ncbi:MAG: hypothetical protein ACK56H_07840, partial [Novosphingobium sp.]
MTVLYRLGATAGEIAARFGARTAAEDPWAGGTVSPGSFAPVVTAGREFIAGPRPPGEAERRLVPRLWGVPPGWETLLHNTGAPEGGLLIGFKNPALKPLTGKTLAQVAAMRGTSPEDTIIDLVIEDDSRVDAAFF